VKKLRRSSFKKKPSDSPEGPTDSGYFKYTNIIYLLIGTIAVAFGAGYLLDKILHLTFPAFKLIFSFGGVILALYLVFKELNKK